MAKPAKPAGQGSSPSGSGTGWAIYSSVCLLSSADPKGKQESLGERLNFEKRKLSWRTDLHLLSGPGQLLIVTCKRKRFGLN